MAEFYSVSLEEMDAFLRPMRFQPVDLTYRRRPVKEWVYQRPVPSRANHFVRVYTGINRYGQQQNQSRGVGKDAIRVQVIYRDEAGNETLVTQPKRVHRVQGWADNLANRLEEINRTRPQVAFDSRGKPMTLRKGKTGWFWGSSDYPRYKETRPFASESDDEWGGLPVHEINSLEELIDIFESRFTNDKGEVERTNEELLTNSLFKINFSGIYGVRTILGPSKIIYGVNLLQSNRISYGEQQGKPTILQQTYPNNDIVSVECPFIPTANKESKLEDLIKIMKTHQGYNAKRRKNKNTIIFDMKGVIFAADPTVRWNITMAGIKYQTIQALKTKGWRPLKLSKTKRSSGPTTITGEIEILGGVPQENIVYEEIPPVAINPLEVIWENRDKKFNKTQDNIPAWTPQPKNNLSAIGYFRDYQPTGLNLKNNIPWRHMTDEEMIEHWNQFATESAPLAGQTTEALYEIKIYVPSTNLDQPVSESEFQSRINETQEKLSELFGGFTTTVGDGGYLSQKDGLISEPVMIVTSWANPKDYQNKLGELESFLREKQQTWGQEVIGFEFENDFFMFPEFETYEAPYQPDQTMQDYTLSELTTSSAISGYQPYKYSASHGAESDDEWGGLPVHEINSLKELIEIFESRYVAGVKTRYSRGGFKDVPQMAHTNYELLTNSLFKINFSGVYGVRTINGPSKVIYGVNLLQSNQVNLGSQVGPPTILKQTYPDADIVSVECPFIPTANLPRYRSKESKLEDLIEALKPHGGWSRNTWEVNKNTIIFDMKGVVFAADIEAGGWDITMSGIKSQDLQLLRRNGWRPLKLSTRKNGRGGEIEILGGVPQENIVYEEIPPVALNPEEVTLETRNRGLTGTRFAEVTGYWYKNKNNFSSLRALMYNPEGIRNWQDMTDEEMIEHWNQFAAEDNYEATYGKAQAKIRRRLKKKIKAQAIMGTKAGQWSARKSQELKRQYEAACEKRGLAAYKGQKTQSQKNLSNWSQQKWRTASGKNSSDTGEPYFPAKAVEALKKKGLYAKAKRQKAAATKAGKQSARYSDDIRAVVRKYRAESDAIPKNWELIEYEGHPALYRHIETADYNTTWQLVEFADDLNMKLKHHATVQFTAASIEIWLWTHDSETITYRDEYWAEAYDELLELATVVDNLEFDSESVPEDWEDIKWKEEKPEHIGDSAEWESEQGSDWGSLRPMQLNERGDYYPTEEAYIEAMLQRFPKMNIHGERGCPVCGSETLFMRETTGKGLKWRCYGCNYSDESLSEKSKKIDTLEKFGLTLRCPDCGEDFKAYNREAIRYHQKKCGA